MPLTILNRLNNHWVHKKGRDKMFHKVDEMQQFNKIVGIISILLQLKAFVPLKQVITLPLTLQWSASPSCWKLSGRRLVGNEKQQTGQMHESVGIFCLPMTSIKGRIFENLFWKIITRQSIGQNGFSESTTAWKTGVRGNTQLSCWMGFALLVPVAILLLLLPAFPHVVFTRKEHVGMLCTHEGIWGVWIKVLEIKKTKNSCTLPVRDLW